MLFFRFFNFYNIRTWCLHGHPYSIIGTAAHMGAAVASHVFILFLSFPIHYIVVIDFEQVLDEADRLLNEDFEKILNEILAALPRDRKTYLFSATMTKKVLHIEILQSRVP